MLLKIVHYNDPVLRQKGAQITAFDAGLAALSADMLETMHVARGIGLAAQQVGRALQLCVVDLRPVEVDFQWELDGARPPLELIMPMVIVNPRLKVHPGTDDYILEEGCLSFPEIRGEVIRPDAITVQFSDEKGVPHSLTCDGMFARCLQHEIDHLNGVLFIDRMEKKVRTQIDQAVKELARQTRQACKVS